MGRSQTHRPTAPAPHRSELPSWDGGASGGTGCRHPAVLCPYVPSGLAPNGVSVSAHADCLALAGDQKNNQVNAVYTSHLATLKTTDNIIKL